MTLNSIAENIAYKLGDQFNHTLRESIKMTVLDYRAKYIRDDLERNPLSEMHFIQVGNIEFERVNILLEFGANYSALESICPSALDQDKFYILKSKKEVPMPVRVKSNSREGLLYLGRTDGSRSFRFTTLDKYPYIQHLAYTSRIIYYTIINRYIYILNNLNACDINDSLHLCNAMLRDIFEDPTEFYNACENQDTFIHDMPFPISRDMLMSMSNAILKGEFPMKPKDGETVNIASDDNK